MIKNISILTVVTRLWVGCASKKCGPNDYNGLGNALFCDYDAMEKVRKTELRHKVLERNKLFHRFQWLIAEVIGKKENLNLLQKQVSEIDDELREMKVLLLKVDSSKSNLSKIVSLKKSLLKMKRNMLTKRTFFTPKEASATKLALIENADSLQYAKAFNTDNLNDIRYAKVYSTDNLNGVKFSKAYEKDVENDQEIRVVLSKKINKLSNEINNENISTKRSLLVELMNEVEDYNNSMKSS